MGKDDNSKERMQPGGMGGAQFMPPGQQPGQPRQIQIKLDECTDVLCECGHEIFEMGIKLKKVPVTSASPAAGQTVNMSMYCCKKCGVEMVIKK